MQRFSIILLTLLVFSSCDIRSADDYYDEAFDLEKDGKYEEAIRLLNKAISKRRNFRPALINRGADKSMIGDFEGAIEDYKLILAFDPDNTMVLNNIGNNFKRLEKYQIAINYYNEALKTEGAIKSDSIRLFINYAGRWDSDSDYRVKDFEIIHERGIAHLNLSNYNSAIEDLKTSIKYGFEIGNSHNWLGQTFLKLNDTLNARKHLKEAVTYGFIDAENLLKGLKKSE
ncbi:tetratricopeptide repeat protein [Dokdonia sp. R86516]|uniref:tetratricopeptide repeat protein n=1 Tax=Dokdonia sp. R86516 TaxID=3093856 RepID=UPI0037C920DA